jgi:hypothetical protein
MTTADLSASHINALSKFYGVRALTETSLARALNVEKAVARHTLTVLASNELVKRYASWEYVITRKGSELLASLGLITAEPAPDKTKRKTTATIVGADVQADGVVLGEPVDVEVKPSPKPQPETQFSMLVRQGLERLNKQMNFQSTVIEDRDLKISTLATLADTLDGFDKSISMILRNIATDLNKFK